MNLYFLFLFFALLPFSSFVAQNSHREYTLTKIDNVQDFVKTSNYFSGRLKRFLMVHNFVKEFI